MYKSGVKNKHHTGTGNSSLSKLLFSIEVDRVLFFFFFFDTKKITVLIVLSARG